ncbi:Hypothetical_protein [Hexamita inflata]|uniref:Hypothetical_protein n=1 Tax=Hexamita inflata TaxID=28002 RepID=A0ABP1H454_9EUKA
MLYELKVTQAYQLQVEYELLKYFNRFLHLLKTGLAVSKLFHSSLKYYSLLAISTQNTKTSPPCWEALSLNEGFSGLVILSRFFVLPLSFHWLGWNYFYQQSNIDNEIINAQVEIVQYCSDSINLTQQNSITFAGK